jgi:hypothetical protein
MMTTANLEEGESIPKDTTADVNYYYDAEAGSQEEPSTKKEVNAEDLNGFLGRQAKRMARNPFTYLCGSLLLALLLSAIAIVVGEFSISSENRGRESRDGTLISDRQTPQLLLTQINQEFLSTGGDDTWEDLLVTSAEVSENNLECIFRYIVRADTHSLTLVV